MNKTLKEQLSEKVGSGEITVSPTPTPEKFFFKSENRRERLKEIKDWDAIGWPRLVDPPRNLLGRCVKCGKLDRQNSPAPEVVQETLVPILGPGRAARTLMCKKCKGE